MNDNVSGGIGSPRHYGGGVNKDQPLLSPSHQHGGCQATANHNQQNPANSQHYTNQQHTSMLYHTSANSINNHDVPNNQFCYDRTSVSMYGTGPGDPQDARSMPPSNTTGHQMGGKSCDLLMSCDHHCIIIPSPTPIITTKSSYFSFCGNVTEQNRKNLPSRRIIMLYMSSTSQQTRQLSLTSLVVHKTKFSVHTHQILLHIFFLFTLDPIFVLHSSRAHQFFIFSFVWSMFFNLFCS